MATSKTSNAAVEKALTTLDSYMSAYSGEQVDESVSQTLALVSFINDNVITPSRSLTGDFAVTEITKLTRDMWLESVILYCKTAFSASASEIKYEISTGNGANIVTMPQEFMFDQGAILVYHIDRLYSVGTVFNAVCSSTKAFGEIVVKLNFR